MRVPQIALSENGPVFSRLALGAWRSAEWKLSTSELQTLIHTCLDLGITTFDHADIYGDYTCEGLFGAALKLEPGLRNRLQLVSKCGIQLISSHRPNHTIKHYDTCCAHILASVDHSLKQLHTDYLDLLLIHRPDPLMDADEVAIAFTKLRQLGKVRYFGVSNFTPSQVDLLASRLNFPIVTNQIEISVMHLAAFQDGTLDQCQRSRMVPMAWSPLGGGNLFHSQTEPAIRVRQVLNTIAQSHPNTRPDQIALAWLLTHPARILPILGTAKVDRLQAAAAATELQLSREQWFRLWTASTGTDVP